MSSSLRTVGNSRTTPMEILDVTRRSISSSSDEAGAIASTSEDLSSADFIETCWCLTIWSATCSAALSVRDTELRLPCLLLGLDNMDDDEEEDFGPSILREELDVATFMSASAWGTKSSLTTKTTGILDFLATRASVLQGHRLKWVLENRTKSCTILTDWKSCKINNRAGGLL